jgi:hypothetical protein
MNFYDRLINGHCEGIDFITWDKDLHLFSFVELFKQLRASRAGHPWINEETEYLQELYEDGQSIRGISKELCRSVNAVIRKLQSIELLPDDFVFDLESDFDPAIKQLNELHRSESGRDH